MQCKVCNYPDSRVVETTKDDRTNQIRRRRECIKCGGRFTTTEHHKDMTKPTYKTSPPNKILDK